MSTFARENFSDQLSIATPEGVALRFPVAGMGSRCIAVIVDHILQVGAVLLIGLCMYLWEQAVGAGEFERAMHKLDTLGKWFQALVGIVVFCLWWGYFALFEAFWRGQTPGKRLMKIRVIKDAGRQITPFEAAARNLLRIVDYAPSFYAAGAVTMACNQRNKRLGDLAAGTMVVHEGRDEQPLVVAGGGSFFGQQSGPGWSAQSAGDAWLPVRAQEAAGAAAGVMFAADALARLGANDLLVIDTFFARALDLPMDTRAAMALRIAATLCAKMGVAVPPGNPERALEAMLRGLRSGVRRF